MMQPSTSNWHDPPGAVDSPGAPSALARSSSGVRRFKQDLLRSHGRSVHQRTTLSAPSRHARFVHRHRGGTAFAAPSSRRNGGPSRVPCRPFHTRSPHTPPTAVRQKLSLVFLLPTTRPCSQAGPSTPKLTTKAVFTPRSLRMVLGELLQAMTPRSRRGGGSAFTGAVLSFWRLSMSHWHTCCTR